MLLELQMPSFKKKMESKYGIDFTYEITEEHWLGTKEPRFYLRTSFNEPMGTLKSFTIRQVIQLDDLSNCNQTAQEQITKSYLEQIEEDFIKQSIKKAFNLKP